MTRGTIIESIKRIGNLFVLLRKNKILLLSSLVRKHLRMSFISVFPKMCLFYVFMLLMSSMSFMSLLGYLHSQSGGICIRGNTDEQKRGP